MLSTRGRETASTSSIWASLISRRLTQAKKSLPGTEKQSQETQDGFCALKTNGRLWHHPDTGIVCSQWHVQLGPVGTGSISG